MNDPGLTSSGTAVIAALYIGVPLAIIALQLWFRRSKARKRGEPSIGEPG